MSGLTGEKEVDLIAKPQVLSSLAYVELELALSLAAVAAVERENAVFQFESTEGSSKWLLVKS